MPRYGEGAVVGRSEERRSYVLPGAVGAAGAYGLSTAIKPPVKAVFAHEQAVQQSAQRARSWAGGNLNHAIRTGKRRKIARARSAVTIAGQKQQLADAVSRATPGVVGRITSRPYRLKRAGVSGLLLAGAGAEAWRRSRRKDSYA